MTSVMRPEASQRDEQRKSSRRTKSYHYPKGASWHFQPTMSFFFRRRLALGTAKTSRSLEDSEPVLKVRPTAYEMYSLSYCDPVRCPFDGFLTVRKAKTESLLYGRDISHRQVIMLGLRVQFVSFFCAFLFRSGQERRLLWEHFRQRKLMRNAPERRLLPGPGGRVCGPSLQEIGS
jgi:hypothetical protein